MRSLQGLAARLALLLVLAAAAAYLLAVLGLMAFRVPYPYEIEWLEGAVRDHVSRVAQGQRLYVPPSLDFVPFLYPPLYYVLSALVTSITGGDFLGMRLVSALSSIGCLGLIAMIVFRETGRRDAALIGAGLFAATFRIGGAWFDVGRVDMLALVLVFGAFAIIRYHQRSWTFLAAGLLLSAAFFTKQTAAIMAAPVVLWMVLARPAQGVGTALVTLALSGGGTLVLDALHDGWYRFYLFELPSNYRWFPDRMLMFFTRDLVPVAIGIGVGLMALLGAGDWKTAGFRLAMTGGLFAAALLSRSNDGGYDNVLLPAFLAISVMAAIGFDTLRRGLAAGGVLSPALATTWPSLVLLGQFAMLVYNPLAALPSAQSAAAGDQFVARLRQTPGDVWVPYHGHLAVKAGKTQYAHWMAIADILRYGDAELRTPLAGEVTAALAERRFRLVALSNAPFLFPLPALEDAYERSGPAFAQTGLFFPLTGSPRRPEWLYVPRPAAAP